MREVAPKELQKLNSKSFKKTQKIFRRRLREIAADGNNEATYKANDYCCGEQIKPWLESLGFQVKDKGWGTWYEITWPEEEDIIERLRRECMPILNSSLPDAARRAIDGLKVKQEESGTWKLDPFSCDYVCSACGKHSEYKTDFCCNCGTKMIKEKENK